MTCLHLSVGRDAYVSDCSTGSNAGTHTFTYSDRTDGQTDAASNDSRGIGKGKVISSQQMRVLSDEMPLALLPRDSITKAVCFTGPTAKG